MQPKKQEFRTSSPEFLGMFIVRVDLMVNRNILSYLSIMAKTNGWVSRNDYLDSYAKVAFGFSLRY